MTVFNYFYEPGCGSVNIFISPLTFFFLKNRNWMTFYFGPFLDAFATHNAIESMATANTLNITS